MCAVLKLLPHKYRDTHICTDLGKSINVKIGIKTTYAILKRLHVVGIVMNKAFVFIDAQ